MLHEMLFRSVTRTQNLFRGNESHDNSVALDDSKTSLVVDQDAYLLDQTERTVDKTATGRDLIGPKDSSGSDEHEG